MSQLFQNQVTPNPPPHRRRERNRSRLWWEIAKLTLRETMLRFATHAGLLLVFGLWIGAFHLGLDILPEQTAAQAAQLEPDAAGEQASGSTVPETLVRLPGFEVARRSDNLLQRQTSLHTIIPDRERLTPTAYWVQAGDTLFGVADKFGLRPESILLNNYELFEDDPHRLEAGQLLQIPAVDGILYIWHAGDGVVGVASFFGVTPETIIDWPGNDLPADLDLEDPDIESGTQIMIPGGQRKVADWRTPRIRRANPSSARILGPGACDSAYDGPVGSGNFTWPLAGSIQIQYRFDPVIHPAIDLYAPGAHDVLAVDAGVVVYSGGHDWGLGHMVVLDHGNGWQSLYADLAQVDVVCGQSVFQGDRIAALEAGNGAELPVLHLEILQDEFGKVDPVSFFP